MQNTLVGVQTKTGVFQAVSLGALTLFSGVAMFGFLFLTGLPNQDPAPVQLVRQPTVQELTTQFVQDGATYKEITNPSDKSEQLTALQQSAEKRARKLLRLATDNPNQLDGAFIDAATRATFPAEVQSLIEQTTELSGTMTTR